MPARSGLGNRPVAMICPLISAQEGVRRLAIGGDPLYPAGTLWAGSSAVEHLTFNQTVAGSIPAPLTTVFQWVRLSCGFP